MSRPGDFEPIVAVERSGLVESVHTGAAVVLDPNGTLVQRVGNPNTVVYGRSCNKPLQADAMLAAGVELTVEQLALACASHAGADQHLDVVRSTLAAAGLDVDDLGNTATLPLDEDLAARFLAAGGTKSAVVQNCSGKHAAMLATCVANGWSTGDYLDPAHPLQQAITDGLAGLAGGVHHVGIDGCGAPTHATSLLGLARAFSTLAVERRPVWVAMTAHPGLVSGDGRPPTRFMHDAPGLMAKDGADGVFAGATPDGWAIAVKIGDGGQRAVPVAFARALQSAGMLIDVDPATYGDPIMGHGQPVGRLTPLF